MNSAMSNHQYTFKAPRRQYFDFPSDVISHLFMNPKSGNGLEKLYQTCKYFFSKRKILVIKQYGRLTDNMLHSTFRNNKNILYCNADIRKINSLIWPTGDFEISHSLYTNYKTNYRCSVRFLTLYKISLFYDEFEFLVSENTVKYFDLCHGLIYYSNNSHVTLDVILKKLPNVEKFSYRSINETYLEKTLQKMSEIPFKLNLNVCTFNITNISNDFDPALLCKFFERYPLCNFSIYIINPRSTEINQNIQTALKNITEKNEGKKLNVTVYPK